jgi:hypothetical protein
MSAFMVNSNVMAKVVTAILLNLDTFDGESTCRVALLAAPTDAQKEAGTEIGRKLFLMNRRALRARYGRGDHLRLPEFVFEKWADARPIEQFKAMRCLLYQCSEGALLHGSVAGRSRPPAFAFMRDERTPAALARACGLARRQQWPPRSSAALWSVSAARHRSLACSGRYRPPPGRANCNQIPAASPSDRARRSAADAGRAWSARCLPLRLAPRSNAAVQ